jgi:hypothetical protein
MAQLLVVQELELELELELEEHRLVVGLRAVERALGVALE